MVPISDQLKWYGINLKTIAYVHMSKSKYLLLVRVLKSFSFETINVLRINVANTFAAC